MSLITLSSYLSKLRRLIGYELYDAIDSTDSEFFKEILYDEALPIFSSYYPNIIRNIIIKKEQAIKRYNHNGHLEDFSLYKIPPILDHNGELRDIIHIENFFHPINNEFNNASNLFGGNISSFISDVNSVANRATVRITAKLINPDKVVLEPVLTRHYDFLIDLAIVYKLEEIPHNYFHAYFMYYAASLTKAYIYDRYKTSRESKIFAGIEINSFIEDFSSAREESDSWLEKFKEDWVTNPDRFAAFTSLQTY